MRLRLRIYRTYLIRTLIVTLVLPLLYAIPINLNTNLMSAANAEVSVTFSAKVLAEGVPQKDIKLYLKTSIGNGSGEITTDADGKFTTDLFEGYNYLMFYNNNSQSIEFVNSDFYVLIKDGKIVLVREFSGADLIPESGIYIYNFVKPNVTGKLTVDGIGTPGSIYGVFNSNTNLNVNFKSVGPNNKGEYGLKLPPGTFDIYIGPYNQAVVPITCTVPSTGNVNCDATSPGKNLKFKIYSIDGNLITKNVDGRNVDDKRKYYSYLASEKDTGLFSTGVSDGNYSLIINSGDPGNDGLTRTFKYSVKEGLVSELIDTVTNEKIIRNLDGIFELSLASPNFVGIVKSGGIPQKDAWSYASQSNFWQYSMSDSVGKISFRLPNGENTVYINPNESDTQSVSSTYIVKVISGLVSTVTNTSGETITADSGIYNLSLNTPNLVGKISKNGVGVPGSIYGVWNTVGNKWANYQLRPPSTTGDYGILVPAGNYDILVRSPDGILGLRNCQANVTIQVCNFAFPEDNLKINLFDYLGNQRKSDVSINLSPTTVTGDDLKIYEFPYRYEFPLIQDANGTFVGGLLDGEYFMRIDTSDSLGIGVAKYFDLTIETGTVTKIVDRTTLETLTVSTSPISISFTNPNLKIRVKANGINDPNLNFSGYKISSGKSEGLNGLTDRNGVIARNLADGIYQFNISPSGQENPMVLPENIRINVDSGTVTSITKSNNETITATDGIFDINLPSPNLTGSINYGGTTNYSENIYGGNIFDLDNKTWSSAPLAYRKGEFGAKVPIGNYAVLSNIYGRGIGVTNCAVNSETSTVCNLTIPRDNFIFKIQTPNGEDLFRDVSANIILDINGYGGTGSWVEMQNEGLFKASLLPLEGMKFSVQVNPNNGTKIGTSRSYKITMVSDSVTAVTDEITGTTVTAVDGVWPLKLGLPNIAGTVTDSSLSNLPIPNTTVRGIGPYYSGLWLGTDSSGYFATTVGVDGNYKIWAIAPESDMTKADSARSDISVLNGVGKTDISLKLRIPNVKGVVSGPKGISRYNFIQVLKRDENGNYQYLGDDIVTSRITDSQGNFAYYLELGTYRFIAQTDDEYAGGARTVSEDCVVTSLTELKTCSFSLQSFNLKLKIKSLSDQPYTSAYVWLYRVSNPNGSSKGDVSDYVGSGLNQFGQVNLSLSDGEWQGRIEVNGSGNEASMGLHIKVETNTVTSLIDEDGNSYSSVDGIYNIKLSGSNLTGTITANNDVINYGAWVNVLKANDDYFEYITGRFVNAGKYALKVPSGTYVIEVQPFPNGVLSRGSPVRTRLNSCIVPNSGDVICDIKLTTGNLFGEITTPMGEIVNYPNAYIVKQLTDINGNTYENWDQSLNVQNGKFVTKLENVKYRLWVGPNWKINGKYTYRNYEIQIESDTVKSVRDLNTNETVTATITSSGEKYVFKLGSPSVTGKVLKPDGSPIQWVNVSPHPVTTDTESVTSYSKGDMLWQYQTWTNDSGEYSLALPNGTYDLYARVWGSGYVYTNSAPVRVTVNNSAAAVNTDLQLRSPNLTGRVVSPSSSSTAVPNVNISGWYGDQYFDALTDSDGHFGAYIDSSTASCIGKCSLTLYPNDFGEFVAKTYTNIHKGDLGDLTLGQVNTKVKIQTPTNGGAAIPNKWSWISVNEIETSTGSLLSSYGASANEQGIAGLALEEGHKYEITAYPSWDFYAQYSPKTIKIDSYNSADNSLISIIFDSPNVTFVVQDKNRNPNAWGWVVIYKLDGTSYNFYTDGYLNELGRAAMYIPEGSYKVHLYPGKGAGVEGEVPFAISGSGEMTSSDSNVTINSNNVAIFKLFVGNVTGKVFSSDSTTALANIPITAIRKDDSSIVVTTVSNKDGSYELNLNAKYSWTVAALNPDNSTKKVIDITGNISNEANMLFSNQNIVLT